MICKFTGKSINSFMSFGKMPLANGFIEKKNFKKEFFYELKVGFSENVSLFQLNDHPEPKKMFHKSYPFYTGSSKFMVTHFEKYANWCKKILKNPGKVIELGSNDGTFLKNFRNTNFECIGFEPSKNVSDVAIKNGIKSYNCFFSLKNIGQIKNFFGKTDLICAANVICHIPDLNELILCIDKLLSKKGLFIFEEPYLGSVYEKTSYDQIYDEHIYLFSAHSIKKIFEMYNMTLIDCMPQKTHGGSMRYVIARKNTKKQKKIVNKILDNEKRLNLDNSEFCKKFKKNCELSKFNLKKKLTEKKNKFKKICGYAATSKSTTILNYCNIGTDLIDFISDTTPEKIGKYSPGMHIPIKPHSFFIKEKPDIAVLFAWNHQKEIMEKEQNFSRQKVKWLTFFPKVKIW